MSTDNKVNHDADANLDPITGEPGAHPVGTGIGAASAGVVATAVGTVVAGPIGGAVGAVIGAVAGGLAGKGVAEQANPTLEEEYWSTNYTTRPYIEPDYDYNDYGPAYRTGYEGYSTYASRGLTYDAAEPHLQEDYKRHNQGRLAWEKAKHAARDAWDRMERALPGDADHDGK
ncbi:MAG: hypothetical protein B0A82_02460 [Alkalinema sp. CACIAM 70d]|nr:MAG: hypothetical protein B0A82_02460 [Alkalinema sp. CACIAM 70d]